MLLFLQIFTFIILGALFVVINVTLSRLLQWRRHSEDKLISYECGEKTEGPTWIQFNNRFYIVALIFLIFDAEIVFLFPWAIVYQKIGIKAFIAAMIFLGILAMDFIFLWMKGDLDWIKPDEVSHG